MKQKSAKCSVSQLVFFSSCPESLSQKWLRMKTRTILTTEPSKNLNANNISSDRDEFVTHVGVQDHPEIDHSYCC